MEQIDWSKAQYSDTHYDPINRVFVNFDAMHDWDRKLIPRPAPQCSGEGLPPVGTVCEYRINGEWQEINVVAHVSEYGKKLAVFQLADVDTWSSGWGAERFRPIRTPEQIAAEERKARIEKMSAIAFEAWQKCQAGGDMIVDICAALYDAGLRFPEGGAQ